MNTSLKLRYIGDKVLETRCEPITVEELQEIVQLLPQLSSIMKAAGGIALAANQVGILKRFFIMSTGKKQVELFINPEIVEARDTVLFEEGCLSILGFVKKCKRYNCIKLKYKDAEFVEHIRDFSGITAVAVQHEIDHLDGKLLVDDLPKHEKMLTLSRHRMFINKIRHRG